MAKYIECAKLIQINNLLNVRISDMQIRYPEFGPI